MTENSSEDTAMDVVLYTFELGLETPEPVALDEPVLEETLEAA